MLRILALGLVLVFCPGLQGQKTNDFKLTDDETKILALANAEREKLKLPTLQINTKLLEAARLHNEAMAKEGKLDHTLNGMTLSDRLKKVGYAHAGAAENIAHGTDQSPGDLFKGWLESPLHKQNLLDPKYTEVGVAWTRTLKGESYATQVFGRPAK